MAAREALEAQADLTMLLRGKTCTQLSLGGQDALIIDFGELRPNPDGQLAGDIVLVLECPWRIDSVDLPVVGWEDSEEDVADHSTVLIGATIEDVEVRRPGFDLILQFSNQHRLRVFPDCRAYYSEEMSGGVVPWQILGRGISARSTGSGLNEM